MPVAKSIFVFSILPHTNFPRVVSSLKSVPTCASVMSDSGHVPNVFPTPSKLGNSFRPLYYLDVPIYPKGECDCPELCDATGFAPPPFGCSTAWIEMTLFFNVLHFGGMTTGGEKSKLRDCSGEFRHKADAGWKKCGNHWAFMAFLSVVVFEMGKRWRSCSVTRS